jgi:hypothetical protein
LKAFLFILLSVHIISAMSSSNDAIFEASSSDPQVSEDVIRHIIRDVVVRAQMVRSKLQERSAPLSSTTAGQDARGVKPSSFTTPPFPLTETMAAFMVRAVVMDPRLGFDVGLELTKKEVERLIKLCVERLTRTHDAAMETVKMQVFFDTNFPVQNEFLQKEKKARMGSAAHVLKEIHDVKTKNVAEIEGTSCPASGASAR